eukprot:symbB.v1.2.012175.t1/scaffold835.1/size159100/2
MLIRSLWRSSITATGATKSCNSRHNGFCCVLDRSDSFSGSVLTSRFRALFRILESKRCGMQMDSGVAMRVHVGEPAFRPAYGFERASPLGPKAQEGEAVPGLLTWFKKMGLEEYVPAANEWCEEMGASVMEEIMEDLDGFAEETETLKKRGRVALSNLLQRGEISDQKAVLGSVEDYKASGRTFLKRRTEKAS